MTTKPLSAFLVLAAFNVAARADELPNTQPLTAKGDLAAEMVAGIDKYLIREIAASVEKRKQYWKPDYSSPEAYMKSVQPNRERLKKVLGVVDARVPFTELEYVGSRGQPSLIAETETYRVRAVRWPVLEGIDAEGLLLDPEIRVVGNVVALPDADWTPEMLAGLVPVLPEGAQYARQLVARGYRVLVPTLIDRKDTWSGNAKLGRMTNQPHREFVYRMAYQMGRHVLGYEVQKVLAAVDWFTREKGHAPVGVVGYGEGGVIALLSGALDPRIRTTTVLGAFGPLEGLWREPIYRNVAGLLTEFGNGELRMLFGDRDLFITHTAWPAVEGPPAVQAGRSGAAPGKLNSPREEAVRAEFERYSAVPGGFSFTSTSLSALGLALLAFPRAETMPSTLDKAPGDARQGFDPSLRQKRQFDQLVAYTQKLMRDSEQRRQETFWSKLNTTAFDPYQATTEPFRKQLWEEVLGKLPAPTEPPNPRTRLLYDEPKYKAYEVTLDLYPDVYAYGILCVPKDMKPGEKRPVVVCQHGLEGRPQDVVNPRQRTKYYNSFGSQLADLGYVVFAPQNPYIGQDKFRVLQRKANPLGLSLFSFIIRQHERILDWLATQPFVDADKMAFYGLSYGGKTAMRVPAVLPRYCLSICSGDFNEWTWKNVSIDYRGSYMFTGEYEMPEFNLGHTLVYAEMAALIAPRPFMVERGHDDGVGIDEWVAYEYAKVRRLYDKLGIGERTDIEYFNGGHEINGKGTFAFLRRHLGWPK